jgi:hypothetical protein
MERQIHQKKSDIISASEIGQYHYCSIAWYLQRSGFQPKSEFLDKGLKKHKELGHAIDEINYNLKKSMIFKITGLFLLIIVFFILIFEVIG